MSDASNEEDIQEEYDWFWCDPCGEEFNLPESTEECPFCGNQAIRLA